jgi:hypothetical protein
MTRRYLLTPALLALFILVLSAGSSQAFVRKAQKTAIAPTTGEAATLRQAYSALHAADHDYHGHRIKAMHAIEAAARTMHVNLRGDGKGHEPQGESDSHLRKAKQLLEGISSSTSTTSSSSAAPLTHRHRRTGASVQIQHAIHELNIALSIK